MKTFVSWGKNEESAISELEQQLGFSLPADYRSFLIENNGGRVDDDRFFVEGLGQHVMMDVFYGVTHRNRALTLSYWAKDYGDELQEKTVIIGTDPGGGMITYITSGEDKGVYYWDHAHFFEESTEEDGNTYYVADSFADFCAKLTPYVEAAQ
ncbi:SMI1/KNR4 family protein [Hymenobacter weizhouensis]|uniref:SMI1/KNR4 family protein n=1 Tax=Hymenobacter sp. YIM 151500-1 TaxID=2987689 RepID=UPI00222724F6|nr:SMI1/KNR4 family protein [Hymenobacter sp. YIM 151500-1]UYZ64659.1 SMI1/KNR4 family protein [Hymenobacter sp. YIM 151500-1]